RLLGFSWPEDLAEPLPGQFFTFRPVALTQGDAGLLRRPLAFAGVDNGVAYSLYQVRGIGTKALAAHQNTLSMQRDADLIDVIGPLGNAFSMPKSGEVVYLSAGGIGCGPILYLYSYICKHFMEQNTTCILGFRTVSDVPDAGLLAKTVLSGLPVRPAGMKSVLFATDDGSSGLKGTAIDVLTILLQQKCKSESGHIPVPEPAPAAGRHLYACGPSPMLRSVERLAQESGSGLQLSAEQWMACGVGACQGCVLPLKGGGYTRVCSEGPVYPGGQIDWEKP
ncbi:MAG: hypothetical protein LLF89_02700, partial [Spirochaetaceae bacterium]|nr:hypothetical protein [Spirochaetaceae bacterium]